MISNSPLAISNPVSSQENLQTGIYLHLGYPQFCWDNQQCRGNFQVYLNYTLTKLADVFANVHDEKLSSRGIELVHCIPMGRSLYQLIETIIRTFFWFRRKLHFNNIGHLHVHAHDRLTLA